MIKEILLKIYNLGKKEKKMKWNMYTKESCMGPFHLNAIYHKRYISWTYPKSPFIFKNTMFGGYILGIDNGILQNDRNAHHNMDNEL